MNYPSIKIASTFDGGYMMLGLIIYCWFLILVGDTLLSLDGYWELWVMCRWVRFFIINKGELNWC